MKLVIGLGNPGKKYEKTRHNLGFMSVDYYAKKNNLEFKSKMNGLYAETTLGNEKIILLKPQSFMNLSGDIVRKYYDYYNLNIEDLLIIYDDVDFEIGAFRIKRGGSSAGHNGIDDIMNKIGTENIYRVRIGTSKNGSVLRDYVLSRFSKKDFEKVNLLLPVISDVIDDFASYNIDDLMEKYNKKG